MARRSVAALIADAEDALGIGKQVDPKRLDFVEIDRDDDRFNPYEGRTLRVVWVHGDGRVDLYDDKHEQHVGYDLNSGPARGYRLRVTRES